MTTKPTGEKILMTAVFTGEAAAATFVTWIWVMILSDSSDPNVFGSLAWAMLWLAVGVVGLAFYFVPTIIAAIRGIPNALSVAVINLFLGWTLLGWVGALAMAVSGIRSNRAAR